ncbi:outer membrane protein assembly factor BamB [Thiosulfativibrio zosterae]|uniref:Outer membrane protein assembly factor BamB n=1 Tax=Thiosulfativibrio zosterae TaxID=2675053 RepID=A0A6F8PLK9_9GAMM|nr:outer membrane protein assembly factor BamB [Thiosulfativibrio zosterae]BBP42975.1 outer membrane protein assembly factor BamB [Thiosulfativibrio zosterae]
MNMINLIGSLLKPQTFVWLMVSMLGLTACSSAKIVRVPTPLAEMSSPLELQRDWQLTLDQFAYSDSEGLYFGADDQQVYFATPSGLLTAVTKSTKTRWQDQIVWQQKFDQPLISGPTVEEENLILGTAKGSLIALSKKTGQLVWQTQLSSEVLSRAVVADGDIYVRTVDGKLNAVKASTGKVKWVVDHQLPNLSLRGIAPITIHDDVVYVGWESGYVEALSAKSGERLWRTQVAIPKGRTDLERMVDLQSQLILTQGRLFVLGYHGQLVSLNPQTGNLYWSKPVSGFRDFVVDESRVYLVDEDDILSAFDVANGTEVWRKDAYKYRVLTDVLSYNSDQLLLADGQGYVFWIDKIDGSEFARSRVSNNYGTGDKIVRVMQDDNRIYIQDVDGIVSAYRIKPSNWYLFKHPEDPLKIIQKSAP